MADSPTRAHLRRELAAHCADLGYSGVPEPHTAPLAFEPEMIRVSPTRGHIAYGETVLRSDLRRTQCHERLRFFSQRRTRRRSSILFFIGVRESDRRDLEDLLRRLEIWTSVRGGHVHVVPFGAPAPRGGRVRPGRRA